MTDLTPTRPSDLDLRLAETITGYPELLRRVMAAGTASDSVFLNGRKAIDFGRDGDFHVEPSPPR